MVTELKLTNTDVNFKSELTNLMREEARKSTNVQQDVSAKGEAARSLPSGGDSPLDKARDQVLHESTVLDMHHVLAQQMGMEFIDLNDYATSDYKVLRMVPADMARNYRVFPIAYDEPNNMLTLAISDPSDPTITDNLSLWLGCGIHAVVASESEIQERINRYYESNDESLDALIEDYTSEEDDDVLGNQGGRVDLTDIGQAISSPPIKRLATVILLKAINDGASDIHIEPFESMLRVRYRVDGVLREMPAPPKEMQLGLISRLKVLANLDIAETRRPQDGRIKLTIPGGREVDLRVAAVPTAHGESMTMRVLDKSMMQIPITSLGMNQKTLSIFRKEIIKPNGVILVSGPTGCGKTTTLYAAINEVKSTDDKLITTEDPVEYEVDGIVQVNIHESVGLTYARCLRAILRQDPDKILVGEIRDVETAQISIQSALTGHLVFSTIHTNSAAGTVTRLIDMGIEPFLITSSLQAVVGQRLVRMLCPNCRAPYIPGDEELAEFGIDRADIESRTFYLGQGCDECNFSGFKGRLGVFELLRVTEEVCDLVLARATTDEIHEMALKQGMTSLRQDGWEKICAGITSFSEVAAHTPREAIDLNFGTDASDAALPVPGMA